MTRNDFGQKIRDQFPNGLTAILNVSGTRTTYILENGQSSDDPGKISDFQHYTDFLVPKYHQLIEMFYRNGGANLIVPLYPYQVFYARGQEYAQLALQATNFVVDNPFVEFYKANDIDPYFAGTDILRRFPTGHPADRLVQHIDDFQSNWNYENNHFKLIWEVAPIPLFSYWRMSQSIVDDENLNTKIDSEEDLDNVYNLLYQYYSSEFYGVEISMPSFYLGSNRSGELKLRSMLPISMLAGNPFRLFFLPYPTLYLTEPVLQAILDDLTFGSHVRGHKLDYRGQWTHQMVEQERDRVQRLSHDPEAVLGLMGLIRSNHK